MKLKTITKWRWFQPICWLLLGVFIVLLIRFVTYDPHNTHYHANMAVYINGQREEFKAPKYYQEVTACMASEDMTKPQERTHLHDNNNSVVHVHDHVVTWGQFFNNLGWTLGPDFIATDSGKIYDDNGKNQLHIMLNGQDYSGLGNMSNNVIGDKDRLLISYGNESKADLQKQYKTVPSTAGHYDVTPDPKSCSGHNHGGLSDRLKHLF